MTTEVQNQLEQSPETSGEDLPLEEALDQYEYKKLVHGQILKGIIMQVDRDEILIDIGTKAEGVISRREVERMTPEEKAALRAGDEVYVFVIQPEDADGRAVLSLRRARLETSWDQLEQTYKVGDILEAPVVGYNRGGLLVDVMGVRGFVPASHVTGVRRGPEEAKREDLAAMVGQTLSLKIIEMNRKRNRLILSERQASQELRQEAKDELLDSLQEGEIREGVVTSVCDFGVFVDIGGADGLVHLSELAWHRVEHPSEVLKEGQKVKVMVLNVDKERKRIALSYKRTQPEPWDLVAQNYHVGQLVEVEITQLTDFGAFARLPEGVEGLIHISELAEGRVAHPRDVIQVGDRVTVQVIRIEPERKRIGLSLRRARSEMAREEEPAEEEAAAVEEEGAAPEEAPEGEWEVDEAQEEAKEAEE